MLSGLWDCRAERGGGGGWGGGALLSPLLVTFCGVLIKGSIVVLRLRAVLLYGNGFFWGGLGL